MYLFKLRTWIALPVTAVVVALIYRAFDLSDTALVFLTMLFSLVAMYLTDPVGFGLREDPDVCRRPESGA